VNQPEEGAVVVEGGEEKPEEKKEDGKTEVETTEGVKGEEVFFKEQKEAEPEEVDEKKMTVEEYLA